jgi:hypothetical protein
MPHACETCRHWHPKTAAARAEAHAVGECRSGPPLRDFTWPRSKASDTCGEHSDLVAFATRAGARSKGTQTSPRDRGAAPDPKPQTPDPKPQTPFFR